MDGSAGELATNKFPGYLKTTMIALNASSLNRWGLPWTNAATKPLSLLMS